MPRFNSLLFFLNLSLKNEPNMEICISLLDFSRIRVYILLKFYRKTVLSDVILNRRDSFHVHDENRDPIYQSGKEQ